MQCRRQHWVSAVTLGDVVADEEEDAESEEDFLPWLWGF